ncbi:hypothetical protein EXIGLDRAFT_775816 [Exidia glandulosa HHB12029]|uniref:Uncharacterized protein n=1 Tax=Exidia glandulosa HHB12029 TaxID=1314781 RepID=A0A165DR81_EXIGL|nr:hypothetical protein EXIGLDRAFT_775816 [Exidia glandulosa HHB12029]
MNHQQLQALDDLDRYANDVLEAVDQTTRTARACFQHYSRALPAIRGVESMAEELALQLSPVLVARDIDGDSVLNDFEDGALEDTAAQLPPSPAHLSADAKSSLSSQDSARQAGCERRISSEAPLLANDDLNLPMSGTLADEVYVALQPESATCVSRGQAKSDADGVEVSFKLWNAGGQSKYCALWERYYQGACSFVAVSSAHEKLEAARFALHSLLSHPRLVAIPVALQCVIAFGLGFLLSSIMTSLLLYFFPHPRIDFL